MSTLAACRADNFYRPADYDPNNRKKEIAKRRKEGKVKDRKQGARKIRFEMPFHVRCTECTHMIAKGVRFNAIKKKAGRYLGTLIFHFSMPCPICKKILEIKTDPETTEYSLIAGCVRYNDDYVNEEIETVKIQNPEEGENINRNPFLKLEVKHLDFLKGEAIRPVLFELLEEKKIFKDDFFINKTMRRKLKMEKVIIKKEEEILNTPRNFNLPLLDYNEEDEMRASLANFRTKDIKFNERDTKRLESIMNFTVPDNKTNTNIDRNWNIKDRNNCDLVSIKNRIMTPNRNLTPNRNNGLISIFNNNINNNMHMNMLPKDNRGNVSMNQELIQKKHRMDINVQKALEGHVKKRIESNNSNHVFKNMQKIDNGILIGKRTFLKKKKYD